jgi:hypothetical protein
MKTAVVVTSIAAPNAVLRSLAEDEGADVRPVNPNIMATPSRQSGMRAQPTVEGVFSAVARANAERAYRFRPTLESDATV